MSKQIYPRDPKPLPTANPARRWRLDCNLTYGGDGGGWTETWSKGYRTHLGARIAAWWHYHVASWGGLVVITDTREEDE